MPRVGRNQSSERQFPCDSEHRLENLVADLRFREWTKHDSELTRSLHATSGVFPLLRTAVEKASKPLTDLFRDNYCVVIFGSYGRLDAKLALSDLDLMIIYKGDGGNATRRLAAKESFLGTLARNNQCLILDKREHLETDNISAFNHDIRYPMLSFMEFEKPSNYHRRVQVLTEGRPLFGPRLLEELKTQLLIHYDFPAPIPTVFPPPHLLDDLEKHCDDYWTHFLTDKKVPSQDNHKIAKLLALRTAARAANLLALGYITFNKHYLEDPRDVLSVLNLPVVLKFQLWHSAPAVDFFKRAGPALDHLSADYHDSCPEEVRRSLRNIHPDFQRDGHAIATLRVLCVRALRHVNRLLEIVHDPEYLRRITVSAVTLPAWRKLPLLKEITEAEKSLTEEVKQYCRFLSDMLHCAASDMTLRYQFKNSHLESLLTAAQTPGDMN